MLNPKQFVKRFVFQKCGPRLQHKLRRIYVVHEILNDAHAHEPEMGLLKSLIAKGDRVADIGANVGIYTKEMSGIVGAEGKVLSIEPVWENYDILTTVVRKARLGNVSTLRIALGSKLEQSAVIIPTMAGFTGYYWAHMAKPDEKGRREEIEVVTFDELRRRQILNRLDFVKCDVEGGELQIILGGRQLIQDQRPGWLLEVCRETSASVFKVLGEIGYRAFVFDDRLVETGNYRDKEFSNYFFFHPQSACWQRASKLMAASSLN